MRFRLMCDYMATGLWGDVGCIEYDEMPALGISEDTITLLKMWQRLYEDCPSDEPWAPERRIEWTMLAGLIQAKMTNELKEGHYVVLWLF